MNKHKTATLPQDPFLWCAMARSTLAAASQMAWQATDEIHEQRALFSKVAGLPIEEPNWRRAVTWNSAVLVALSAEQSLKALAIMASPTSQRPHTHDLVTLWKAIGGRAQVRISDELQWVRRRVAGTTLAKGTLSAEETIHHHRKTFEQARYYNEKDPTGAPRELTHNIDLWQFALSAYRTASFALARAVNGMGSVSDDADWQDVVAFNSRIGRSIPDWEEQA